MSQDKEELKNAIKLALNNPSRRFNPNNINQISVEELLEATSEEIAQAVNEYVKKKLIKLTDILKNGYNVNSSDSTIVANEELINYNPDN
jgi:hypothetical protein